MGATLRISHYYGMIKARGTVVDMIKCANYKRKLHVRNKVSRECSRGPKIGEGGDIMARHTQKFISWKPLRLDQLGDGYCV
jgi:hypothetical protein